MSSFEDRLLDDLDRKRQAKEFLHPNLEKAHHRTEQIFQQEAVDMNAFKRDESGRKGVYGGEEVDQDKQKARDLKVKFKSNENEIQKNLRIQAEVAEGLVYRGIGKHRWFGEKAKPIKTADYDDYINGIDVMVEFGDPNQMPQNVVGLMMDITFSADRNTGALDKKFERIRKEIEEGHLSSVKYFQSKNSPRFMGTFSDMPRVIIGMERSRVLELATLWVNEDREHELKTHPVQRMILEQISAQLKAYANYAESLEKREITDILRREIRIIQSIIEGNKIPLGDLRMDEVHRQIMDSIKTFNINGTGVTSSSNRYSPNVMPQAANDQAPNKTQDKERRRPTLTLKK